MYYNCYEGCGDQLPDYEILGCDELLGGIRDILVLDCNHQITDPSNSAQVQAEIDAGRAHLIKNIKLGVPAPTAVQVDSKVANQPQRVVAYDRTADYINPNVTPNNVTFHNALASGRPFGGLITHELEADTVTWYNEAVRFTGGKVTPDSDSDTIHFAGTFMWRAAANTVDGDIYDAPTGIFNQN